MDNLKLLSRPLEDLQREVPSMADLDDKSEQNIAEVGWCIKCIRGYILWYR